MSTKLGFGCMRLPFTGGSDRNIDIPLFCEMADAFLAAGGRYFDTAFMYHGGESEKAIKKALTERHPREAFELADKLPVWMARGGEQGCRDIFELQLERTGAGYFDRYLIHGLDGEKAKLAEGMNAFGVAAEYKRQGLIRSLGFSFHGSPEELEAILTAHPELEFVQLQINYIDWDSPEVQARACYEAAVRHGKRVVVMEPVKGGALAAMPEGARKILLEAEPQSSVASWALRFCAGLEAVEIVLSGMSDMAQLRDNLAVLGAPRPLGGKGLELLGQVVAELNKTPGIPCTGCKYCVEACPQHISVPFMLKPLGDYRRFGNLAANRRRYDMAAAQGAKASDCVDCGACEEACPQHLPVRELLKAAAAAFEG